MVATRKDLTADSGATFSLSVQYLDSNEVPVDLTGFAASFIVTNNKGVVIALGNPDVTADGWINTKATDEETALWPLGRQSYRLEITTPAGDVERLLIGTLNVRSAVAV